MNERISEKVWIRVKTNPALAARIDNEVPIEFLHNKKKIGSSFKNNSILRGLTYEEEKILLPNIIGDSPTNSSWNESTKEYWANLSRNVPYGEGLELEIGMYYPTAEAKAKGEAERDSEQKRFLIANKAGLKFTETFTERIKVGAPLNVADYVIYRYCLLYSKCANSIDDAHRSTNIIFYLHSDTKQKQIKVSSHKTKMAATAKYMEIVNDRSKVESILDVMYTHVNLYNSQPANSTNKIARGSQDLDEIALYTLAVNYPSEFTRIAADDKLTVKAFIERAISANELRRIPNTETIVYGDNVTIGANMNDAVVWMSNPENKDIVTGIKARLTNLKKN